MPEIPMFPLGTVLFPYMPVSLRLFEERYLVMLAHMLEAEQPQFGVVLIERGQEVGGGEHRFQLGTLALISEMAGGEGFVAVNAEGGSRFEVTGWLDDDPYPRAEIRFLEPLEWDESLRSLREDTEQAVRRALAVASEFTEQRWASVVDLSDDPLEACWQLAGIAPVGELDQLSFLGAVSMEELLTSVLERATDAAESFASAWSTGPGTNGSDGLTGDDFEERL
ncbi:LON peptidase substrate-binding domain-containing protein [Agreia pratensis]|uniref:LON peptidase substrate-binding domain-containing protein n=1 Tax=Agreia pratensis TaxID=150121 RepID=UPI00188CB6FA|nr:LON peptidase substrate-binding domain-containing protein [Agreia pratensis]MBF4635073.1 LON peptidase substrate-binding domain-containing protein [Agreia pratensis]